MTSSAVQSPSVVTPGNYDGVHLGHRALLRADRPLAILEIGGKVVGLIVDEVSEVLRLNPDNIEPPPEMVSFAAQYITGVGKLEDGIILLLDLGKVLGTEETGLLGNVERAAVAA